MSVLFNFAVTLNLFHMAELENQEQNDRNFNINKIEQYFEENKKSISIIFLAIVVLVGGYWAYKDLYIKPLNEEAQGKMFMAERYFEQDSLELALNGNTEFYGFLSIIEDYDGTPAANLARYYAGICYLHLKDFDKALEYLSDFEADDKIVSAVALGAMGDAYAEKGEIDDAIDYYEKAAFHYENQFITPVYLMKAALLYELQKEYKKALKHYKTIQEKYPQTNEGRDIEKYIARAEAFVK